VDAEEGADEVATEVVVAADMPVECRTAECRATGGGLLVGEWGEGMIMGWVEACMIIQTGTNNL